MRQAKNPQPFSQQQGFQSGGSVPAVQQNPNVPQMNYYDGTFQRGIAMFFSGGGSGGDTGRVCYYLFLTLIA